MYNSHSKKTPWIRAGKENQDWEVCTINPLIYSDGGAGSAGDSKQGEQEPQQQQINEQQYADKSVMDKMNARKGPADSTKADSGGGDADKRVGSTDVDSGPVNNDRGA
jgi:hypothetical protein